LIEQVRSKRLIVLPKRIDIGVLNQFPEFVAFRSGKPSEEESHPETGGTIPPHPIDSATPDEAIDGAEKEITENLKSQLLERIFERSSDFFERLVLNLIVAMKYGGTGKGTIAEWTGEGGGDEGFDGIVNQDVLGLDKIYLQAKRYAKDNTRGVRQAVGIRYGAISGNMRVSFQAARSIGWFLPLYNVSNNLTVF
jgi:restriction system protein